VTVTEMISILIAVAVLGAACAIACENLDRCKGDHNAGTD
jgi:hypothetical protein